MMWSVSPRSRARHLQLAFAAALLAVPACHGHSDKQAPSGQPSAPAAAPSTPATGGTSVTLHATLTLTGTISGTAIFTQTSTDFTSCAAYAAKRDGFELPRADKLALSSGQTVELADSPDQYNGPGTYTAAQLDQASATLTIGDTDEPYQPMPKTATRTLTVKPDGSGSYTFGNWMDPGNRTESGSLTWTCSS